MVSFFSFWLKRSFLFLYIVLSPIFFFCPKVLFRIQQNHHFKQRNKQFWAAFPSSSRIRSFHIHKICFIWHVASELNLSMIKKYFLRYWNSDDELKHQTSQKPQTHHRELNFLHILRKHTISRENRGARKLPPEKSKSM